MKVTSAKEKTPVKTEVQENEILLRQMTAEQNLRKQIEDSEKRYNMMLMQSPFAFAVLKGKDMVVTIANDSIKEMWGKGNKIEGKPLIEILPEIKNQEFPALLHKVYTTGIPYVSNESLARVKRNGKIEDVYFNFVYQPYYETEDTISGVTIIATEITEQVKAKKLIEENEKRFNKILMESPFAFSLMKGKDMVITHANALMKDFWGKGNDVEGKKLLEVLPELKDQPFPEMLNTVYTTGRPISVNEILARLNRHGSIEDHFFNLTYQPSFEADGTISGVTTIANEVTEQVLARKKVEESEKKFQAAILAVKGIIWTNNANGEMSDEQPGWANLTGQRFEDYQGYGWAKAVHPDDAQPTVEAWNKAVANQSTFEFVHRVKTTQNDWKFFSIKAVPVLDENGIIQQWVGVHTDISEQREAEKKIAESEKQQAYMLKLSDALRDFKNPMDIEERVTKIAMDFMDTDRCFYANIEDDNAIILRDSMRGNLPSNAGVYPLSSFTLLKTALDTGSPYVVDDVNTSNIIDEDLKQLCLKLQNHSFINIPVIKNRKPVGIFCFVQNKPRKWTDAEVQLTIATAERTWAAIERAKSDEALRQSEEKYRILFNSMDEGFCTLRVLFDDVGKAIDCLYLEVNKAFVHQSGLENVVGKTMLEVNPETEEFWIETYGRIIRTGKAERFEHIVSRLQKFYEFYAFRFVESGENRVAVIFNDITERKNAYVQQPLLAAACAYGVAAAKTFMVRH